MFRPLLSPQEDPLRYPDYFNKLQYPLMVSPKVDGIRGIVKNNCMLSRTGKMLPSYQVQTDFTYINDLDGELVAGPPNAANVYNLSQSHIMSRDKPGDIGYYVFDYTHPDWLHKPFYQRFEQLESIIMSLSEGGIFIVGHEFVNNREELEEVEAEWLRSGYEGVMMRNPEAAYKNGRATFSQNIIYKLKRFVDAEAIIIGFVEGTTNDNPLEENELGYAKRSTSKENLIPADTLGTFVVDFNGLELNVAPGQLDHEQRKLIWDNQEDFIGKYLKFRYFAYGVKDKPRQPRAVDIRDPIDL